MDACANIISPHQYWPGGHLSKEQLSDTTCYRMKKAEVRSATVER
jgi:hypothetical protein